MKKYEFLCIAGSDLVEGEIQELVLTLKNVLSDVGAVDAREHNLGKKRLAYPFKGNMHYGTFLLFIFEIEPENVALFKEKIRFIKGISRNVIREYREIANVTKERVYEEVVDKVEVEVVSQPVLEKVEDKFVAEENKVEVLSETHESVVEEPFKVEKTEKIETVQEIVPEKEEKKEEKVKDSGRKSTMTQEELDRRIDELLAEEINPDNL